jgi:phage terminase large subunit GpA-like protein
VKGVEGFNRASPVSGPTFVDATDGGRRLKRGARLWTIAVSTFKAETYRFLRLDRPSGDTAERSEPPAGTIHLPGWVDSEWVKQLVAEQLVTVKTKRGFQKLEWQKLRDRNEALDCRVYARAAAWIAGADRWSERKWAEMERELGARPVLPNARTVRDALSPGTTRAAERSRQQGSWLGDRGRNWLGASAR